MQKLPENSHRAGAFPPARLRPMKLGQNQVYRLGDQFLRIVHLARLEVHYKTVTNLLTGEGTHHKVSKKEFCRLIKAATLLTQEEVREIWRTTPTPPDESTESDTGETSPP